MRSSPLILCLLSLVSVVAGCSQTGALRSSNTSDVKNDRLGRRQAAPDRGGRARGWIASRRDRRHRSARTEGLADLGPSL